MFFSFFSSKNQKLVKKWKSEHEQIVKLATKVINTCSQGKQEKAKDALIELRMVTLNHLMTEDIEFFKLLKDTKKLDHDTEKFVNEFKETFYDTKAVLRRFLKEYTSSEAVLDDKFLESFKGLVGVLGERIAFEEKNLYNRLDIK